MTAPESGGTVVGRRGRERRRSRRLGHPGPIPSARWGRGRRRSFLDAWGGEGRRRWPVATDHGGGRVRFFRRSERERKGARGCVRERRMRPSPWRPYPRPGQAGGGRRRRLRPACLLARGGRRQNRGFSENPPEVSKNFTDRSFSIEKPREKQEFEGLSVKIIFFKFDI